MTCTSLSAVVIALAALLPAQDPPQPTPKESPSWPALSDADAERAALAVRRLDAEEPGDRDAAEAQLVEIGAAVAPLLIQRLGDRQPTAPDTLRRILHRIVQPVHAPLVAEKASSRSPLVREWTTEFLALQHDERWRAVFVKGRKEKDRELVFRASLGLAALKDTDALGEVFDQCSTSEWRDHAELVSLALAPARSNEMAEWLVRRMGKSDERAKITGLRLMRSLAPSEYAGVIATFLDAEQQAVKKEAINALRAVVDGEPPLEDLDVFRSIEQAKKWKARIR